MKRIVFVLALLTVLTVVSFAATSKGNPNYKHQAGGSKEAHKAKKVMSSHRIIHPVDHFTI